MYLHISDTEEFFCPYHPDPQTTSILHNMFFLWDKNHGRHQHGLPRWSLCFFLLTPKSLYTCPTTWLSLKEDTKNEGKISQGSRKSWVVFTPQIELPCCASSFPKVADTFYKAVCDVSLWLSRCSAEICRLQEDMASWFIRNTWHKRVKYVAQSTNKYQIFGGSSFRAARVAFLTVSLK